MVNYCPTLVLNKDAPSPTLLGLYIDELEMVAILLYANNVVFFFYTKIMLKKTREQTL